MRLDCCVVVFYGVVATVIYCGCSTGVLRFCEDARCMEAIEGCSRRHVLPRDPHSAMDNSVQLAALNHSASQGIVRGSIRCERCIEREQ